MTTSGQNCGKDFFRSFYVWTMLTSTSTSPWSQSSSKYDLRGKCRRTCIRQGTRYGRAIAPTLMELLHDHPTIYSTSSTSALLPAHPTIYNTSASTLLPAHSTLYNTNTSTSLHAHPTIHNTSTNALLHAHPRRRNRATSRSPNSPRHKNISRINFSLHANTNILIST